MAKEKSVARASFLQDLFQFGVYKRNQGRVVRQVTFAAMAVTLLLGSWQLFDVLQVGRSQWRLVPGARHGVHPARRAPAGRRCGSAYRLVNFPQFADFLIAVEAEMNKVSWPSRTELIRSSLVVIFMMFFLAFVLFGFDLIWQILFKAIGVIHTPSAE